MATRYKYINGIRKKLTAKENAERDAIEEKWNEGAFDRAIKHLRMKRDNLLKETDYLALSDNTMTDEMKTYRQELRDITNNLTTEEEVRAVEFPTKP